MPQNTRATASGSEVLVFNATESEGGRTEANRREPKRCGKMAMRAGEVVGDPGVDLMLR